MTIVVVTRGSADPTTLSAAFSPPRIMSLGITTPVIVRPSNAVMVGVGACPDVRGAKVDSQEQYSEHRMLVEQLEIVATANDPPGHDP